MFLENLPVAKRRSAVPFGLIEESKAGETGGLEDVVLTLYLGPFVCRDLFSASRSLTVCFTRTPWYTLLEYSADRQSTDMSDAAQLVTRRHTNFHPFPQMCGHLNASQFYAYRRMTLWDWCVNVMEIAFGLVNANGLLKRGN